jgi:hypothetical protein
MSNEERLAAAKARLQQLGVWTKPAPPVLTDAEWTDNDNGQASLYAPIRYRIASDGRKAFRFNLFSSMFSSLGQLRPTYRSREFARRVDAEAAFELAVLDSHMDPRSFFVEGIPDPDFQAQCAAMAHETASELHGRYAVLVRRLIRSGPRKELITRIYEEKCARKHPVNTLGNDVGPPENGSEKPTVLFRLPDNPICEIKAANDGTHNDDQGDDSDADMCELSAHSLRIPVAQRASGRLVRRLRAPVVPSGHKVQSTAQLDVPLGDSFSLVRGQQEDAGSYINPRHVPRRRQRNEMNCSSSPSHVLLPDDGSRSIELPDDPVMEYNFTVPALVDNM